MSFSVLLDGTIGVNIGCQFYDLDILYTYAATHLQEPVSAPQPGRRWPVACGNTADASIP